MNKKIDQDSRYELAWKYFHQCELIIVQKLNDEKDVFRKKYLQLNYFYVSQKRIIDYFIKKCSIQKETYIWLQDMTDEANHFCLVSLYFYLKNVLNLNVLVWGTTGTAAKNIEGVTVHNAFRYHSKMFWIYLIQEQISLKIWKAGYYYHWRSINDAREILDLLMPP